MNTNWPKAGEFEKAADVIFADPVRLDEFGAKADFTGEFEYRVPELIVVEDDQPCVGSTVLANGFKRTQNIDRIENVVEEDVVEFFAERELFRVSLKKVQVGVPLFSKPYHHLANFDANSVRRLDGCEQLARLAADREDAFSRLDDELEQAFQAVVKILVGAN